ncbi:STAS-like domain-containing protein [candidate division KSB1 bacterium]|nr:STAS-like domain-containing protein [candidate division KSB1 bacterium]
MKKLNILDLVGEDCITIEDGEKVYDLIHSELKACRPVELDFAGVTVFTALFFNSAFGRLLKDLTTKDLERLLKISNLTPLGRDTLKLVIKNSNEYYRDPAVRKAVDEILSEQAEEI